MLHADEAIVAKTTQFVEDELIIDLSEPRLETLRHTAHFDEDVDPALDDSTGEATDPDTIEATVGAARRA